MHKKCVIDAEKNGFFSKINAAIYNATITKKYLLEQEIRLLDHPVCSPDLNSIENFRGLIVANVYEGDRQYSTIFQFKNAILDAWGKIPSLQHQKLADSMPSQIFEGIKANGRSTKY